jgi:hypothetical protein
LGWDFVFFGFGFFADFVPGCFGASGALGVSAGLAGGFVADAAEVPEVALVAAGAFDQPESGAIPDGGEGFGGEDELQEFVFCCHGLICFP